MRTWSEVMNRLCSTRDTIRGEIPVQVAVVYVGLHGFLARISKIAKSWFQSYATILPNS